MKAMVLAAGLGTRLRPLTDSCPKALAEINGRTLLEITLSRLRSFGISEVIINVHHFADMVVAYLKSHNNFGMRIEISREDDLLLDTGGGLKKAAWFFLESSRQGTTSVVPKSATRRGALAPEASGLSRQPSSVIPSEARNPGKRSAQSKSDQNADASGHVDEPFLLHNVDVISNIDFRRMLDFHNENRALATLAVQSRNSSRQLLFNDQLQLVGRAPSTKQAAISSDENPVISSEARNPSSPSGGTSKPARADRRSDERRSRGASPGFGREESAFSSRSPLVYPERLSRGATRHSPLLLAFSGIHVISPRLLPMLTDEGVFSIIDVYLRLASQGEKILAFRADEYYWRDLGRPSDLAQAARDFEQKAFS
jgi:NDP-sugar pyrophosphorylase family protein